MHHTNETIFTTKFLTRDTWGTEEIIWYRINVFILRVRSPNGNITIFFSNPSTMKKFNPMNIT